MGIKFELYQFGSKHLSKRLFEAFEADENTYDTALEIIKIGFQSLIRLPMLTNERPFDLLFQHEKSRKLQQRLILNLNLYLTSCTFNSHLTKRT